MADLAYGAFIDMDLRRAAGPVALVGALLLACALPASAQVGGTTATLRGTVTDATGAVAPGVAITLIDAGTTAVRVSATDEHGTFTFSGLFPATYDLRAELDGFKAHEERALVLGPNDTRGLDIQLEVGNRTETVTVTTPAEFVQTETGAREGRVTARQIENLSVIGRSPLELLRILPGVVAPDQSQLESVSFGGGANCTACYSVNGIRSTNNTVSLDGSNLIDIGSNSGTMITLNDDMVQEVKVQSSNFAAEYGAGGMNVSAVTKSGTSSFHGAAYWYGRDYHLAANDRSNNELGIAKPTSRFFYPGGNVGGPIPLPGTSVNRNRDRLFFWVGMEVQRQTVDPGSHLSTTVSAAARNGDLSEFLANRGQNLNHPVEVLVPGGFAGEGTPAPANDLTPYVRPLGLALANLYPLPNYTDADNRYNYVYSALEPTNRVEAKARVDWTISASTKAYVRIAMDAEDVESPLGLWCRCSQVALAAPEASRNRGRSYAANLTEVLSATTTNEVLVSFTRLTLDNAYDTPTRIRKDALGVDFQGLFADQSPYVPLVLNNSWGGSQLGDYLDPFVDVYAHNDELLFADKLTKVRGSHALKAGASLTRLQKQQNGNNFESGALFFAPGGTPGSTRSQIGDMLVGRPQQIQQGTRIPDGEFRMWNLDGFAQDSWRIRTDLTLEFGARFGYWTNNAELNGLGAWFDPATYDPSAGMFVDAASTQLNGVRYAARGQTPLGLLDNRGPFALPRLNAAWDVGGTGRTVLRGGYGVFFNRPLGNVDYDALFVPPNAYSASIDAYYDTALGGTGLTYDTVHLVPYTALLGSQSIYTPTPRSFAFPQTRSYSLSVARRIVWNQVVEAAYVGTTGRRLVSQVNANVVPLGALSSGTLGESDLLVPVNRVNLDPGLVNTLRPYAAYGPVYDREFEARSQYHSLQVTVSRQAGGRLQYFAAYTLSRATGTVNGDYGLRDPFDPSRTHGVLDSDRRHLVTVSWNALLPDAARGVLDHAIGRGLLNGWQLSGISTFANGVPLRLNFSGDAAGPGVSQAYFGTPDVVGTDTPLGVGQSNGLAPAFTCDPRLHGSRAGEKILNVACVGVPAFGANAPLVPPYDLRTPSRMNHDLTLFKNFAVHGRQKLQLRAGLFNVFNMAYATTATATDIDLALETTCLRRVDHVPNGLGDYADGVCDPTGGYAFTPNTLENFGRINVKRGHRVVELAVKYTF